MTRFVPITSLDLAPQPQLAAARAIVEAFDPPTERQAAERQRILDFLDAHPLDAHCRTCLAGHLTAGGLLLDAAEERALLTHHKKLNRWLQLGGHVDGDANLLAGAVREAQEESGIAALEVCPVPVDLDVHSIPARGEEPEHLHLDVRYLFRAPRGAQEIVSEESHDLRWVSPFEVRELSVDDSVTRLFELAFEPGRRA